MFFEQNIVESLDGSNLEKGYSHESSLIKVSHANALDFLKPTNLIGIYPAILALYSGPQTSNLIFRGFWSDVIKIRQRV